MKTCEVFISHDRQELLQYLFHTPRRIKDKHVEALYGEIWDARNVSDSATKEAKGGVINSYIREPQGLGWQHDTCNNVITAMYSASWCWIS